MENSPTKCNINTKKTNLNENDQITNLNTQISLLRTQKTQLEDQIHAQSQQIKNLNQKMFQLQKTFAENRFNSEQDYSLYVKTEKELKQSNESLKSENELLKNEKKIIQISYNQLKDQYSKLKKKQEEQESYYDHLSNNMDLKLSEVTEERDNLFFELSQKKDSEKAFNEFKSVINDLKIQNQELFDKNGSLTETIERISKENEQLRSQLDSAYNNNNSFFNLLESENSIQKLQDTIENDSLRESALVLSLEKAENTIKKLESQNLSLKNEIENLQKGLPSELVNIKKRYNESQDLISNLNERISNMTLQISAIRQENKRLKKRLQASEQRNTNLELDDQLTSMPALQNKIKELEKSSNEQQQTIKTMKELQLKIEEENDQLKLKNSQLSIQNDQLIKEKNDINLRFDPDTAKKVQKLLKKLNQLQYDFFHEDEGLFKHYTERQYRDIIITLKQQLEDAQRTKNLLLKERNEYRKNLNEQLVKQANVV